MFAVIGLCGGCGTPDPVLYRQLLVREQPTRSARDEVRVTWLGVAGFWIEDGRNGVLIDPYVSRNVDAIDVVLGRRVAADRDRIADTIDRLGMQHLRLIVVSHSHFDHSADAPEFARATVAIVVGSRSTGVLLAAAGVPADRFVDGSDGRWIDAGTFRVRMVPSRHGAALFGRVPWPGTIEALDGWPAPPSALREGGTFGIVVEHRLGTIVHHGSAGWRRGMYDGVRADTVLLGIAGRRNTAALLDAVAGETGARRVVAMHFDDFLRDDVQAVPLLPFVDFGSFVDDARKWAEDRGDDVRVRTLPIGAPRVLFREAAADSGEHVEPAVRIE